MHTKQGPCKNKFIVLLLIAIIYSIKVFAQKSEGINYSFLHTDTTCTFYGWFKVDAKAACVMHISFNYDHIKALAPDASKVELIEEGKNWNKIKYTYQQFPFYKNESLWYRTIDHESNKVNFILISSKNSHPFMPQIISSSGYYKVYLQNEALTVEYFQQCKLTKSYLITPLYRNSIKKKAVAFLHLFEDYIQKHCNAFN